MVRAIERSTEANRFKYAEICGELQLTAAEGDQTRRRLEAQERIYCPFGTEWVIIGQDAQEAAVHREKQRKLKVTPILSYSPG